MGTIKFHCENSIVESYLVQWIICDMKLLHLELLDRQYREHETLARLCNPGEKKSSLNSFCLLHEFFMFFTSDTLSDTTNSVAFDGICGALSFTSSKIISSLV